MSVCHYRCKLVMRKPRELRNVAEKGCGFQSGTWVLKDSEIPGIIFRVWFACWVVVGKAHAFRIERNPPLLSPPEESLNGN